MKKAITITAVLLLTLGMTAMATAQDANDESDVTVDVSEETAVDIDPSQLTYSDVAPGEQVTETDDVGDAGEGVTAVTIENIGSNSIAEVWMDASFPDDGVTPFATGERDDYDTGNFVQIAMNDDAQGQRDAISDIDDRVFVNRVDYEEPNDLSYIFVEDDDDWTYGRFRAEGTSQDGVESDGSSTSDEDEEYFWAVDENAIDGLTDGETAADALRVGEEAHTHTQTGTSDFTDSGENYGAYELENVAQDVTIDGATGDYDLFEVVDGPVVETGRDYAVVVALPQDNSDEVFTARTRFNTNLFGEVELEDAEPIYDSDRADSDVLEPGDNFPVDVGVAVPRGVPGGESSGILTVNVVAE